MPDAVDRSFMLPTGSGLLHERDREIATLDAAITDAKAGESRLILIEGAAGIGKSRLLLEARSLAERAGFNVVTARGNEFEREYPFGVVREMIGSVRLHEHANADRVIDDEADRAGDLPRATSHDLVEAPPAEGMDQFIAAVGPDSGSPLVSVELRHMGGAMHRSSADHGARNTLNGELMMFAIGVPVEPFDPDHVHGHLVAIKDALAPHKSEFPYPNFVEEGATLAVFFDPQTRADRHRDLTPA